MRLPIRPDGCGATVSGAALGVSGSLVLPAVGDGRLVGRDTALGPKCGVLPPMGLVMTRTSQMNGNQEAHAIDKSMSTWTKAWQRAARKSSREGSRHEG
jgi:hypothetical protein